MNTQELRKLAETALSGIGRELITEDDLRAYGDYLAKVRPQTIPIPTNRPSQYRSRIHTPIALNHQASHKVRSNHTDQDGSRGRQEFQRGVMLKTPTPGVRGCRGAVTSDCVSECGEAAKPGLPCLPPAAGCLPPARPHVVQTCGHPQEAAASPML